MIDVSEEQNINAWTPIDVIVSDNVIDVSEEHDSNKLFLIDVILGNEIDVSAEHDSNAWVPIDVNESGNEIDLSEKQYWNVYEPIDVNESGRDTEISSLQPLKKLFLILVKDCFGKIKFVNFISFWKWKLLSKPLITPVNSIDENAPNTEVVFEEGEYLSISPFIVIDVNLSQFEKVLLLIESPTWISTSLSSVFPWNR